jgi:hypothetical protein
MVVLKREFTAQYRRKFIEKFNVCKQLVKTKAVVNSSAMFTGTI